VVYTKGVREFADALGQMSKSTWDFGLFIEPSSLCFDMNPY